MSPESLEWWKSAFEIGGVVLLLLTFFAGAGVVLFSRRVNDIQAERLRQFDKDLTAAKTDLAIQQERAAIADARAKDADARIAEAERGSAEAMAHSASAQASLALAEQHSAEANAKAEGFRLDIAKANESAATAQAQVAGATAEAAKANLELAKIKTPRSLIDAPGLASSLKVFKGTEYTFSSVFQDPEAISLLITIDSLLQLAEWKRVKPPNGFPAINIFGENEGVTVGFGIGISIQFNSPDSTSLPLVPFDKLPPTALAAVTLQRALLSNLSPKATDADVPKANVEPGDSTVVRITVGRKP